jgi:hypothetical protein
MIVAEQGDTAGLSRDAALHDLRVAVSQAIVDNKARLCAMAAPEAKV